MSKTAKIREALDAGPLSQEQLLAIVGGTAKQLSALVTYLKAKGQVKVIDGKVQLHAGRKPAPPQGRRSTSGKKSARKAGKKKTYRSIADRLKYTPAPEQFRQIIIDNLVASGALLRQAIEDGVDGLDENFAIKNAIANQQRAEQLYQASIAA